MSEKESNVDRGKRQVLRKSMYVVPAVLTLAAAPSFASAGSSKTISAAGGRKGRALEHSKGYGGGGAARPSAVADRLERHDEGEGHERSTAGPPDGRPSGAPERIASR